MAPQVGIEPTTLSLTGSRSTVELLWRKNNSLHLASTHHFQKMAGATRIELALSDRQSDVIPVDHAPAKSRAASALSVPNESRFDRRKTFSLDHALPTCSRTWFSGNDSNVRFRFQRAASYRLDDLRIKFGGGTGNRTPAVCMQSRRAATSTIPPWLAELDSNQHDEIQSLAAYHWPICQ
jgi:hypothetical protein